MSQISTQALHFFEKLLNTYTQIRHTGWGKKSKTNKRTGTSIRDPRVLKRSHFLTNYLKLQIFTSYNNLRIGQDSEFVNF